MSLITDITTRFIVITIIYLVIFGFIYPRYMATVKTGWRTRLSPTTLTLLVIISISIVLFISVVFDLWRFNVIGV